MRPAIGSLSFSFREPKDGGIGVSGIDLLGLDDPCAHEPQWTDNHRCRWGSGVKRITPVEHSAEPRGEAKGRASRLLA